MQRLVCFLCLSLVIVISSALPTVREKTKEETKTETKLEKELDKLSKDGVSVSKIEHVETKTVNGKTEQQKVDKESIKDAKTGQLIANVEKSVSTNEKGEQTNNVHIDFPAAGVHQDLQGEDAENFELLPPETMAQYLFETDDTVGVQSALDKMVDSKTISKKSADSYVDQVRSHLDQLNEQAYENMVAQAEEQKSAEDQAYQEMLELTDMLNTNYNTEQTLYVYIKKLYAMYKKDGDEYAKSILMQYTNLIEEATQAGNISETVQDEIYSIILQALKDVNEELSQNNADLQQTEENEQSKS